MCQSLGKTTQLGSGSPDSRSEVPCALAGSGEVGPWGQAADQARKMLPRPAPPAGLRRRWLLPSVCEPQAAWPQAKVRRRSGIRKARSRGPKGEEKDKCSTRSWDGTERAPLTGLSGSSADSDNRWVGPALPPEPHHTQPPAVAPSWVGVYAG